MTQQVKISLQFLMVILVSEEHDDTAAFCKDVLCDVELLNWVQANDCVVWAGNVADSEAHTGTFPFSISILCRWKADGSVKFFDLYEISFRGVDCKYTLPNTILSISNDTPRPNRRTSHPSPTYYRSHHRRHKNITRSKSSKSIIKRTKSSKRTPQNARRSLYQLPCRRPRKGTSGTSNTSRTIPSSSPRSRTLPSPRTHRPKQRTMASMESS